MSSVDITWRFEPFEELSATEVYALLRLRSEVFVVEQECAYLDPDGLDLSVWHCLAQRSGTLLAYQRCIPPGLAYEDASALGRIVVSGAARGENLGRELVRRGIAFNRERWPEHPLRIGAQSYLEAFYASLGFEICSEPYLEDGIPHIHMQLS